MNRWLPILVVALTFFLGGPRGVCAQRPDSAFEAANRLYDQGKFREAAEAYQRLIQGGALSTAGGGSSAAVYFNLGNALFKSGQLGRAIAVYRSLEAATPRDPDLRANLRFALARVQGPTLQDPMLVSWIRRLSLNEWAILTSLGFWIMMLLLALGQLRQRLKKGMSRYALAVGLLTLFAGVCLAISIIQAYYIPRAIVIAPEASVRRGPLEESESPFTVYDGAQLQVLDRNNEWAQITAGNGKIGWIRLDKILAVRDHRS